MGYSSELAMKVTLLDDASKGMEKLTKLSDVFGKSFDEAKKEAEKFSKSVNNTFKNVGGLDDFSKSLEVSKDELIRITKEMEEKAAANIERFNSKVKTAFGNISKYAKYGSAAIIGFAGVTIKEFASYQQGVIKAQTISNDSFSQIDKNIRSMATSMGISVQELNEGLYQTVSAVGDVSGKYSILSESAKLAIGGFTTTNQAVDIMTTVLNAYGMKAEEVTKISDILIQTQNKGKTTVNQLAGTLGNVIPTAAATGTKLEEVAVAMALLTANGISTDEAGTAVNAMLTELAMNSTKAGKLFKSAFGTSFNDYMKQGGSLVEALKGVQNEATKTGDALIDVFNRRSFKAAQSLTGASSDRVTSFTDAIYNSSGSAENAFEKMQTSMTRQMQVVKEKLKEVSLSIGQALLPRIQEFNNWLQKIDFEKVFSRENVNTIIAMGKAVLTLYGVLKAISVLKTISSIFSGLTPAVKFLSSTASAVKTSTSALYELSKVGAVTGGTIANSFKIIPGLISSSNTAAVGLTTTTGKLGMAFKALTGFSFNPLVAGIGLLVSGIGYLAFKSYQSNKAIKEMAEQFSLVGKGNKEIVTAMDLTIETIDKLSQKMKENKNIIESNKTEVEALALEYPKVRKALEEYKAAMMTGKEQNANDLMNNYFANTGLNFDVQSGEQAKNELNNVLDEIKQSVENKKIALEVTAQISGIDEQVEKLNHIKEIAEKGYFQVIANDAEFAGTNIQKMAEKLANEKENTEDATLLMEMLNRATDELSQKKINLQLENKEALESSLDYIQFMANNTHIINVVMQMTGIKQFENLANNVSNFSSGLVEKGIKNITDSAISSVTSTGIKGIQKKIEIVSKAIQSSNGDLQSEYKLQLASLEKQATQLNTMSSKKTSKSGAGSSSGSKQVDELKKKIQDFQSWQKTQPDIWNALGTSDLSKAQETANKLKDIMQSAYQKGNSKVGSEFEKKWKEALNSVSDKEFDDIIAKMNDGLNQLPEMAEILGLDDTGTLKKKISEYQSMLQNMLNKINMNEKLGIDVSYEKSQYSNAKEKYKQLQNELKASEEVAKKKKEEQDAIKNIISTLNSFGSNMKQLGEDLSSEFLKVVGEIGSSFSTVLSGLQQYSQSGGASSIGGMFSNITKLFSGGGSLAAISTGLSSLTGITTAVSGVVAMSNNVISSLSGSGKKNEIEAANKEQLAAFDETKNTLNELVDSIKDNMSSIRSWNSSILSAAAGATTLDKLNRMAGVFDTYVNAMMSAEKNFGEITTLTKGKTSYSSWFSSKSATTYKSETLKESDLLRAMGITGTQINFMNEGELKSFAEQLKSFGIGNLRDALGGNYVDSTLEEWKQGVFAYVEQLNKLREAQKNLVKNATLSDFSGMQFTSYNDLINQYTEMYESMGLNADAYKKEIEEMARANQVLVSSMITVRDSFVDTLSTTGNAKFSDSMSSYFTDILKNVSKVIYDVSYSSIDNYFTGEFERVSNKLADMKTSGVINFDGFWDDFNFNKILEGDRIQNQYDTVINDLRYQLESRGFSQSLIDSVLPATELSERINSIRDMLNSAMSSAITSGSFDDFSSSLGQSIYDSVKDSLVSAFTDSEVYKQYIDRFFNTQDIEKQLNSVSSAQEGFGVIQDYLNNLDYQLQGAGLARNDSLLSTDDTSNDLGNGYYTNAASGLTIQLYQYFTGVYGETAMYDIAKQAAIDGINETKAAAVSISTIGSVS